MSSVLNQIRIMLYGSDLEKLVYIFFLPGIELETCSSSAHRLTAGPPMSSNRALNGVENWLIIFTIVLLKEKQSIDGYFSNVE